MKAKKVLSLFLAVVMVMSTVSGLTITAGAATIEGDEFNYTLSGDEATIVAYTGDDTEITVPATIDGYTVVAIEGTKNTSNSAVTSVTISEGITTVGDYAFRNYKKLQTISIASTVTTIGSYAFYGCAKLESIDIPTGVTSIGSYAFYQCTTLTEVVIPSGITEIADNTFYGDTALTSVTIPEGVTTVGEKAFQGCSVITEITLPSTVTAIGANAFYGCQKLLTFEIPSGVTVIETNTFYNCRAMTSVTIPEGVTSIGEGAFYNCIKLASIDIPSTVTSIGKNAFYGDVKLTELTIPEGVVTIGEGAFRSCTGLTSISLSNTVETIGKNAFYGCTGLTSVTIPASVTSIGDYAFTYCSALAEFAVADDNEYYTAIDGVLFTKDGTTLLFYPIGNTATTYTTPYGTETISSYAFAYSTILEDVILLETVSTINSYAFFKATALGRLFLLSEDCTIYDASYTIYDGTYLYGYYGSTLNEYATNYYRVFNRLTDEYSVEPTCTETGLKTVSILSTGEVVIEDTLTAALGHSYKSVYTSATCSEDAYTTYTCTRCGDVIIETEEGTATGAHNNDIVSAKVETQGCVTITTYEMVCLDCGTESTETITSGEHDYDEGVYTAATCVDNAYTTYTCTVCGQEKHSVVLNSATGVHTGEWKIVDNTPDKICTVCGETYVDLDFTDISAKNVYGEYYDYVAYTSYYNSFIRGVNSTTLEPKRSLTRSEIVTILYRMAGSPYDDENPYTAETNPFSDVKTTAYYFNAACWALDNGVTTETKFKGTKAVSRQETATFLYRYACEFTTADVSVDDVSLDSYPDADEIKSWAEDAMKWANKMGMITGTQQGYLEPTESTLRIHATKIVYGFGVACNIGNFE